MMNKLLNISITILLMSFISVTAFAQEVMTRANDNREFEYLELKNKLKVLLISDETAPKAAAALDVNVGSGEDPFDRAGLAHFLEHMLFLGSEAFPKADEFSRYISENGGSHNAFTSLMHTNYFFDINVAQFEAGLARFSSMFVSPLLDEKYVEREVNAVHSEFTSKFEDDYRRTRDVMTEVILPNHSLSKFATGNLETLSLATPRPLLDDLKKFYQQHYSADNMTLVMTGPYSVTQLRKWAKQYFTDIPLQNLANKETFTELFPKSVLGKTLSVTPKKEVRKLSLIFPIPATKPYNATKPTSYLGHIIGHEAEGSVLSVLKEKGWATGLSAGGKMEWRGGEAFTVDIKLTPQGLLHISTIKELIFEVVELARQKGINDWRFDEISRLGVMGFEYGEPVDPIYEVLWLASRLHRVAPEAILAEPYHYTKFDEALIARYLDYLAPNNALYVITAPELKTDKVSRIYQTPYRLSKNYGLRSGSPRVINESELTHLKSQLNLPAPNDFIPTDFSIVEKTEKHTQLSPEKVINKGGTQVWYANDNTFDVPKASFSARIKLPQVAKSPEQYAAAQIFAKIITESLSELSYNAALGGLSYSIGANYRGVSLEFEGYNDSLKPLSDLVAKQLSKYLNKASFRESLNQQYFEKVKDDYIRRARNQMLKKPYGMIYRDIPAVIYAPYWTSLDVLQAFESISYDQYELAIDDLFISAEAEIFVFGNVKSGFAKKMAKQYGKVFNTFESIDTPLQGKVVELDLATAGLRQVATSQADKAVALYIQGRDNSYKEQALTKLTIQLLANGFYSQLRTEQQLGYIVNLSEYAFKTVPGMLALVQSPHATEELIIRRIDAYLDSAQNNLTSNLDVAKQALIQALSEKPRAQRELKSEYWGEILTGNGLFDANIQLISAIESTTESELNSYYKNVLRNPKGHILFIAAASSNLSEEFLKRYKTIQYLPEFKAQRSGYLYP